MATGTGRLRGAMVHARRHAEPGTHRMASIAVGDRDNVRQSLAGSDYAVVTTLATIRRALEVTIEMARLTRESLVFADQGKSGGKMIELRFDDRSRGVQIYSNERDHDQQQSRHHPSVPCQHIAHSPPFLVVRIASVRYLV